MSFDDTKRQRLAALLTEHSVKTGTFTLASGQTSDIYCDVKKTALLAEGAYLCGLGLYSLARQVSEDATGCGGLTLGADPLVTAMAIASHLEEQRDGLGEGEQRSHTHLQDAPCFLCPCLSTPVNWNIILII